MWLESKHLLPNGAIVQQLRPADVPGGVEEAAVPPPAAGTGTALARLGAAPVYLSVVRSMLTQRLVARVLTLPGDEIFGALSTARSADTQRMFKFCSP